jgi:hypothetical protein
MLRGRVATPGGRNRRCPMKRMRMNLLSLVALALLVAPVIVQAAEAGIRFDATVNTTHVRVRLGSTPSIHYRIYRRGHLPIRRLRPYRIVMPDRRIAQRFARYTGVPARELIQLRRRGYTWFEIGRWLGLPRRVVVAAMHRRSWNRFLLEERRLARCGAYRFGPVSPGDYCCDD